VSTDSTLPRAVFYAEQPAETESEALISKATWSLKLSGLVCGVLLVIGRSASYGNVTWNPTYHAASAPLVVVMHTQSSQHPTPPVPKTLPNINNALLSKRSAASEVIAFSPGRNADSTTEGEGDISGQTPAGQTAIGSTATVGGSTGAAGTAPGSTQSTIGTGAAGTGAASASAPTNQPRRPPAQGPALTRRSRRPQPAGLVPHQPRPNRQR
jgi:hypothetical protein